MNNKYVSGYTVYKNYTEQTSYMCNWDIAWSIFLAFLIIYLALTKRLAVLSFSITFSKNLQVLFYKNYITWYVFQANIFDLIMRNSAYASDV